MKKIVCDHCGSEGEDVKIYALILGDSMVHHRDLCDKCVKKVKDAFYGSVGN